jgi:hypothetical protein
MDIPKHIKYLSILFFLNAALALLIGGLTYISLFKSTLAQGENISDLSPMFSLIFRDFGLSMLFTLLAIVFLIVLGISLRKLKPWARTVALAYGSLTILFSLLSLLTGDGNFSYQTLVQIYAVWVLTRPEIKEAFLT